MKKITIILFSTLLITGMSCKKYLDDAYLNPNNPSMATPEEVLPSIIANMHRGIAFDARMMGPMTQYYAITSSNNAWERHGYAPGSDAGGEIWRMHYWNFGWNILDMIRNANNTGKHGYTAVAYTALAWGWLNVADYHGEAILKQAFERDRLQFSYDKQEEIYPHVISIVDSAIAAFALAGSTPLSAGDQYFYGGDLSKWKKFAYGVKAKAYHRYFNKANYKPDSVIKYVDLSLASTADDALVRFNPAPPDATGYNFYAPIRNNFGTFRAGAFPINLMNGTIFTGAAADPRLRYIFKPSGNGSFYGLSHNQGDIVSTTQRPPNFWGFAGVYAAPAGGVDTGARTYFKNVSPFPIMTYAELQFLKSEAAFKKGDNAGALAAYKNGIRGNMDMLSTHFTGYLNFTSTQRDAYVNDPIISPATLTRKMILLQKYIALWGWGFVETWVDLRKENYDVTNIYTGYTIPTGLALFPDNSGKLCYRVRPRYNSEYLWNVESLRAIGALNPDYHTYPVWFSKP